MGGDDASLYFHTGGVAIIAEWHARPIDNVLSSPSAADLSAVSRGMRTEEHLDEASCCKTDRSAVRGRGCQAFGSQDCRYQSSCQRNGQKLIWLEQRDFGNEN
eukprot:1888031-Rhodomonas_salina.1